MGRIVLDRLSLGYDRHPAVNGLTGVFQPGSLTAVVGPNGSGKSTLLKALAGHEDRARLRAAIAAVGLDGLERRPLGAVSGGQLQRALFARVMVQEAELVLLDEPFTGIDARAAEDLAELMAGWPAQDRTVVAVLHDLDLARRLCPQTLVLAREQVAWGPSDQALTTEPLALARRMAEAWRDDQDAPLVRQGQAA